MKIILFIILSIFFIMGCDEPRSWPRLEFDQASWLRSAESERYKWVQDIIDSRRLDGLSSKQVIDLLGTPSSQNPTGITYIIKIGGAGFNQVYILDIRFNEEKDIVESYFVRGD